MRGQAATEFILLLAFILLLILPAGYYIFTNTSESTRVLQGDLAVNTLAKTADYVYYQSPGAKQVVTVFLPGGVEWSESYIGHPTESGGEEINLALYTQTGEKTHIFVGTEGEVRGTWPDSNGNFRFMVRKTAAGYVIIGPYEQTFLLEPQSYTTTMIAGSVDSFTLTATELDGSPRTLTLTPNGEIADWLSLGTTSLYLGADAQNTTTVTITLPVNTSAGVYTGTVDATDGEVEDVVYITVISLGPVTPPGGIQGGLLVEIIEPTNSTYTEIPVDLEYTVNMTPSWCGYSLDGSALTTVSGNVSMFPTNGPHHVKVLCVSSDGKSGWDEEWFTTDFGLEPWCFNLTMLWAYNSTYHDVMAEISTSNNVYANEMQIVEDQLSFIDVTFEFAINPDAGGFVIHNMSQGWEHYESDSQIDPILQWQMNNGWGATVCQLPAYQNPGQEALDICTLSKGEVPDTPGEVLFLSTRIYYLSQASSAHESHVDWTYLTVCYGEAIKRLTIESPLDPEYNQSWVWFNVSSNALMDYVWYSLDGAANVTMPGGRYATSSNVSVSLGPHMVTFYANDSNGNILSNSTSFNITIADTTPPVITIVSPLNATYTTTWVWMNITLDESGSWAGYSLDGAANVTMSGSGTAWYYNASGLAETGHNVTFYANDSSGNMGASATRWFTVDTTVSACPFTIDLWELGADKPQPIEFTSGLNTTANTFGITGASDGWDWAWNVYDTGSTCVFFNGEQYVDSTDPTAGEVNTGVNAADMQRVSIGDNTAYGGNVCNNDGHGSGAYAVELNVTSAMYSEIASGGTATLYFDWIVDDNGLDNNDDVWVKARFGNSTTMTYLGTQVGGGNDDAYADILYDQNPNDQSGSEAIDVSSLITAAGDYYVELGGRVRDWDNNEGADFEFDNVNLNITCAP